MAKPSLDEIFGSGTPSAAGNRPSLDDIFSSKPTLPAPDSMMKQGTVVGALNYPERHPFKALIDPLAKTVTGKSAEDMAKEHIMSEPFTRPPINAPFDRNLGNVAFKSGLEMSGAQNIDEFSRPSNYLAAPLIQAGVKGVGTIANTVSKAPQLAGDLSSRIYNNLVKLPDKAYRYAKDPLGVLRKEKLPGNSITELAQSAENRLKLRNQQRDAAVQNSNKTVDISGVVDAHTGTASSKLTGSLRNRKPDISELNTMRQNLLNKYGDLKNMPVKDAVKLQQQLADDWPFTYENSHDVVANAAHKMYHDIGDAVDIAEPAIKDLNHRVSGLIDISRAANKKVGIESRSNPIGLIGTIIGSAVGMSGGGAIHGAESGIAVALALKAASSPAVMTRVAKALAKMSEVEQASVFKAYPWMTKAIDEIKARFNPLKGISPAANIGGIKNPVESSFKGLTQEELDNIRFEGEAPVQQKQVLSPDPVSKKMNIDEVSRMEGEGGPILNNPVADFNPIKAQPNKPGVGVKAAVIGGGLTGGSTMGSMNASADSSVDMNKIYQIESSGNRLSFNKKTGAKGLGQIMPNTLKEWNNYHPKEQHKDSDLYNEDTNKKIASWYMNDRIPKMLKHYKIEDTTDNRLIAYNFGIGHLKNGDLLPKETIEYLQKYKQGK